MKDFDSKLTKKSFPQLSQIVKRTEHLYLAQKSLPLDLYNNIVNTEVIFLILWRTFFELSGFRFTFWQELFMSKIRILSQFLSNIKKHLVPGMFWEFSRGNSEKKRNKILSASNFCTKLMEKCWCIFKNLQ